MEIPFTFSCYVIMIYGKVKLFYLQEITCIVGWKLRYISLDKYGNFCSWYAAWKRIDSLSRSVHEGDINKAK